MSILITTAEYVRIPLCFRGRPQCACQTHQQRNAKLPMVQVLSAPDVTHLSFAWVPLVSKRFWPGPLCVSSLGARGTEGSELLFECKVLLWDSRAGSEEQLRVLHALTSLIVPDGNDHHQADCGTTRWKQQKGVAKPNLKSCSRVESFPKGPSTQN